MGRFVLLFTISLTLAASAHALEILAPDRDCSVADGRVMVIGKDATPPAGQGTFSWEDGRVSLSAWAGRFYAAAELPAGTHAARVTFGADEVPLKLVVAPTVPGALYTYHPKVVTEECKACHEAEQPPAPGSDVGRMCYACHTPFTARSSVHTPVAQGLCSACHDPHGSKHPSLLRWKPEASCTQCHNRPITKAHEKLADDALCTECHDPHGTNRASHLKRK